MRLIDFSEELFKLGNNSATRGDFLCLDPGSFITKEVIWNSKQPTHHIFVLL